MSLYLSIKLAAKRRMIYIPPDLEEQARRQVNAWRESENLAHVVSEACVQRILTQKKKRTNKG